MKGIFIVFEGGEGSGKTTQIRLLAKKLLKQGKKVLITHEPGGTKLADKIRGLILNSHNQDITSRTELFLFLAARAHHVETVIIPALKAGKIILCDRFSGSTFAYQIGAEHLPNEKLIYQMDDYAKQNLKEDLVIYLDVDPLVARKRKKINGQKLNRLDLKVFNFHKKVRNYFNKLAKRNKNWQFINANLSINENADEIYAIISKKIR